MQLRALKPQWGGITFEVVFYYFFRISIITIITGSFFIVNLNYVHISFNDFQAAPGLLAVQPHNHVFVAKGTVTF